MDIWVVAAAAGAGYIAQHWKNILRSRQDFSNSSTESPTFAASEKNCPLRRVLSTKKIGKDSYLNRDASSENIYVAEVASTSGSDGDNISMLDMSCGILNDNLQGGRERISENTDDVNRDMSPQPSNGEMGFSYEPQKRKKALRTQRSNRQLIKPLSSLESCLMAQLYNENAQIEDYVFHSARSPRATKIRPFLVTDGSRIINRESADSLSLPAARQPDKKAYSVGETVYGVPQLPKVKSRANGKHRKLRGSSHGARLFCLGISVGIISSFLENKQEVLKLNQLLKQTENLVQDLQEELEMKDSLTVKELAIEDYESEATRDDLSYDKSMHACSLEHKLDESTEQDRDKCLDENVKENSISRIEAELEAELERLELSMAAPRLAGKVADLVEVDPDFVPDIAVGELKADFFGQKTGTQHYADEDGSGSSTTNHTANYAVSPRELSLRLHEIVQSRLEERVKELETALENSQKKVKYMDHDHIYPWRNLSSSEGGSSAQRSPVNKDEQLRSDHPVVINLSGEALGAYNEAYDLFARINDSEEDKPTKINNSIDRKWLSGHQGKNDWMNNGIQNHLSANGQPSVSTESREEEVQNTLWNDMLATSGDESDHDEMEELLIKHIVEKAKKSSSVILNAQRMLFSNDEN